MGEHLVPGERKAIRHAPIIRVQPQRSTRLACLMARSNGIHEVLAFREAKRDRLSARVVAWVGATRS